MKRFAPSIALIALFATGCAHQPKTVGTPVTAAPATKLGVGDHLKIDVYNEPKLSGDFTVDGDGKVAFPLVGRLDADGKTLGEFSTALTTALGGTILLHPNVSVRVEGYRPVFVLGEVGKPGEYPYADKMTVYSLVARAGGFTYRASRHTVAVRHDGETDEQKVAITSATAVEPGDTIRILERYF